MGRKTDSGLPNADESARTTDSLGAEKSRVGSRAEIASVVEPASLMAAGKQKRVARTDAEDGFLFGGDDANETGCQDRIGKLQRSNVICGGWGGIASGGPHGKTPANTI
jgi:hypothetical protein